MRRPSLSRAILRAALISSLISCAPLTGGCSSTPSNPILGDWKYSSGAGPMSCAASFSFKDQTVTTSYAGIPKDPNNNYSSAIAPRSITQNVIRYMPSPNLVVVFHSGSPDHENYAFTDASHMSYGTPYGKCFYQRS